MKFEEALPLMREGRKMRLPHWGNDTSAKVKDGELVWGNDFPTEGIKSSAIMRDDWEEVRIPWREELKDGSFAEALVGMMRGERWTRPQWGRPVTIAYNEFDGFVAPIDILAMDWRRVS